MDTVIDGAVLADAIEQYAQEEIGDPAERDAFVELYSDEVHQPIIRKAVLDVVVAVVAGHQISSAAQYQELVHLLDAEETDDIVRKMKLLMLRKMTEDAVADMDEDKEAKFRAYMQMVEASLGD